LYLFQRVSVELLIIDPWHMVKNFGFTFFIFLSDVKTYENIILFFIKNNSISRDKGTTKKKHKNMEIT
jgi:hypothetical protein